MTDQRRTITTILNSKKTLRIYAVTMIASFLIMGIGIEFLLVSIRKTLVQVSEIYHMDPDVMDLINQSLNTSLILIVIFVLVFGSYSFYSWLKFINRTLGGLVPILNHIAEMKKGNYQARIKLRDGDELTELTDALNDLTQDLATKA